MPDPVLCYFDTSAFMRWVEREVPTPSALNTTAGQEVADILSGSSRVGVSELTLIEFRASVGKNVRRTEPENAQFTAEWATDARGMLMAQLAVDRIEIVPTPPRAAEHAMTLVDMAQDEFGHGLGAWDAIHLITACAWGVSEDSRVNLRTSDDDYDKFIALYPHFSKFVDVTDLSTLQAP